MAVSLPVHPDLRELWDATPVEPHALVAARRSIGSLFVVLGLFLSGMGAGGLCALLTTPG
jgi:hypothetical protein